jgi:chitodextrinase
MFVVMSTESGGKIYYKTSPLGSTLSFPTGKGSTLMSFSGALINNATLAKAPITSATGLVVLASDEKNTKRYYHSEVNLGAPAADTAAPSVPTAVKGTANGPNQVTVNWNASTDNVGVVSYQVKRGGTSVAAAATGTSFVDTTVSPSTTYTYTVSAVDAAGNRSAESSASTPVTTPAGSTPTPTGQVSVDATAAGTTGATNANTVSWSHTTAGGVNLLLVSVEFNAGNRTVTGVSYAGRALTRVPASLARSGTTTTDRQVEVWSLLSPPAGAGQVSATVNGGTASITGQSATFSGVNTTTPLGTAVAKGGTGANPSVTASGTSRGLVFTAVSTRGGAPTPPSGSIKPVTNVAGTNAFGGAAGLAGASSVTATWTAPAGNNAVTAVPINAAG